MKQDPKNITTEIIRDYPTRFFVGVKELQRLIDDLEKLLKENSRNPKIKFWVGLKNGMIYETDDINTVIAEENARNLKIQFLIIFAESVSKESTSSRRIIVHFSRGQIKREIDHVHLGDDWFNLNYEGISYRIKDRTRDATLKSINAIEERLKGIKTWKAPRVLVNNRSITNQIFIFFVFGVLFYFLSAMLDLQNSRFSYFANTSTFISGAALGSLILMIGVFIANVGLLFFNWAISPATIAIGDEIEQHKKDEKLREYIFWSIGIALILGVAVNVITSYFIK